MMMASDLASGSTRTRRRPAERNAEIETAMRTTIASMIDKTLARRVIGVRYIIAACAASASSSIPARAICANAFARCMRRFAIARRRDTFAFAFRRLRIQDLSDAASQPMPSHDEQVWIVFNGEIYNFKELRRELEGDYAFRSTGDTEVILAAYEQWGKKS